MCQMGLILKGQGRLGHRSVDVEEVREMSLLCDPEHVDYKNKDQRQQA